MVNVQSLILEKAKLKKQKGLDSFLPDESNKSYRETKNTLFTCLYFRINRFLLDRLYSTGFLFTFEW